MAWMRSFEQFAGKPEEVNSNLNKLVIAIKVQQAQEGTI
jgi:hypothetical protein